MEGCDTSPQISMLPIVHITRNLKVAICAMENAKLDALVI